jgi:hypothetical protein
MKTDVVPQKVKIKKNFCWHLVATDEKAGSGSVSQGYGSADPDSDLYQNGLFHNSIDQPTFRPPLFLYATKNLL